MASEDERPRAARGSVSRRELVSRGAAGAAALALAEPAVTTARSSVAGRVDTVVVGAGLAGLTAATRLSDAGRSVVVLEARERVGGRNLDVSIGDGHIVELGGQWAGPGQSRVLALARRLGVSTFAQYAKGDDVVFAAGRAQRFTGEVPPVSAAALKEIVTSLETINTLARGVPADNPWTAPGAQALDSQTIDTFIRAHAVTDEARWLIRLAVRGIYGAEPQDVSLLDLLASVTGVGGDVNTEIGAAQTIRFVGGPQRLSRGLASRLGARVVLGCPISAIAQRRRVTVVAARGTWSARRVVVALPSPLSASLAYDPPLPAARALLLQRQPMGMTTKVNLIYARPFWRSRGLSGYGVSDAGPIRFCYDNSPPSGRPGVLVAFFEGADGARYLGASRLQRRAAAIRCLARWFGDQALHPIGFRELVWPAEPFTRGAYGTYNPPGVLTEVGHARVEPAGAVHFAGADLSDAWPGYMEGAIRSGEQVADAVLRSL